MKWAAKALLLSAVLGGGLGCAGSPDAPSEGDWEWELPAGFPEPAVPKDNPMSLAKVELGRHLFYDLRLSRDANQSCASCHAPALAFADGRALPEGSTGAILARNSPGLQNVAYLATYTWANPVLETLEQQVVVPLFSDAPIELGTGERLEEVLARLAADPIYPPLFQAAFPEDPDPIQRAALIHAIASFMRSMISGGSPYDRLQYGGERDALSASARRGMDLFFSEKTECYHCHTGLNLTNSFRSSLSRGAGRAFENNGLYNVGNAGQYPANNPGLFEFTQKASDQGRFRIPPLRNVALTAPYMHDGSIPTLDAVLDHYTRGGRFIADGPLAGDGARNPHKSNLVRGFLLDAQERADLIAWLEALTDPTFGEDPRFANPWQ
jgi:cytochrome c peroxidase